MGTRDLEGRRTEALVCRPFRAGRVLAPIFRWFLHRLISTSASGAEEHVLECNRIVVEFIEDGHQPGRTLRATTGPAPVDRLKLIAMLVQALTREEVAPHLPLRGLMVLRGLGKEIWEVIDTQDYVIRLREEWDHQP